MVKENISTVHIKTSDGCSLYFDSCWEQEKKYKVSWNSTKGIEKSVGIKPSGKEAEGLIKTLFHIGVFVFREYGELKRIEDSDLNQISDKGKKSIIAMAKIISNKK